MFSVVVPERVLGRVWLRAVPSGIPPSRPATKAVMAGLRASLSGTARILPPYHLRYGAVAFASHPVRPLPPAVEPEADRLGGAAGVPGERGVRVQPGEAGFLYPRPACPTRPTGEELAGRPAAAGRPEPASRANRAGGGNATRFS